MAIKNFQPLGIHLLISPIGEDDELTPGGIIKPEVAKQRSMEFRVEAVGPGWSNEPMPPEIKPDAKIAVGTYSGTPMDKFGKGWLLISYREVLGVFVEPPDEKSIGLQQARSIAGKMSESAQKQAQNL